MGPLANDVQFEKVMSHFASAREQGATIACGGEAVDDLGGYFVRPTVLTGVTPGMRAVQEEIFGPVVAVATFRDEDEAVAPHVPFGGFGSSGIGRENGADAIREYTETKAIWVELSGRPRDPFTLG